MKNISITISDLTEEEAVQALQKLKGEPIASTPNLNIHSISDVEKHENDAAPVINITPAVPTHPTPAMQKAEAEKALEATAAPAAPAAPENNVVPKGGGLDAEGIPWDERIHASTKTRTAKNVWKKKPRLEEGVYEAVIAELKAAQQSNGNISTNPEDRVEPTATAAPTVPIAPPAPAAAQPPAAPTVPQTRDFAGLLNHNAMLIDTGRAAPSYQQTIVDRINSGFGTQISSLADISANAEMVSYAWSCLEVDELL